MQEELFLTFDARDRAYSVSSKADLARSVLRTFSNHYQEKSAKQPSPYYSHPMETMTLGYFFHVFKWNHGTRKKGFLQIATDKVVRTTFKKFLARKRLQELSFTVFALFDRGMPLHLRKCQNFISHVKTWLPLSFLWGICLGIIQNNTDFTMLYIFLIWNQWIFGD